MRQGMVRDRVLLAEPVGRIHVVHARILAGRERVHAGIVSVVHEVENGIGPCARARVAARRATKGCGFFGRCIPDVIASFCASALERVIKTHPMADFMRRRIAQIVRGRRSTGQ